jgi:hypothetical protein
MLWRRYRGIRTVLTILLVHSIPNFAIGQ